MFLSYLSNDLLCKSNETQIVKGNSLCDVDGILFSIVLDFGHCV